MTDFFQTCILLLLSTAMVFQIRWARIIHDRLKTLELDHLERLRKGNS